MVKHCQKPQSMVKWGGIVTRVRKFLCSHGSRSNKKQEVLRSWYFRGANSILAMQNESSSTTSPRNLRRNLYKTSNRVIFSWWLAKSQLNGLQRLVDFGAQGLHWRSPVHAWCSASLQWGISSKPTKITIPECIYFRIVYYYYSFVVLQHISCIINLRYFAWYCAYVFSIYSMAAKLALSSHLHLCTITVPSRRRYDTKLVSFHVNASSMEVFIK